MSMLICPQCDSDGDPECSCCYGKGRITEKRCYDYVHELNWIQDLLEAKLNEHGLSLDIPL